MPGDASWCTTRQGATSSTSEAAPGLTAPRCSGSGSRRTRWPPRSRRFAHCSATAVAAAANGSSASRRRPRTSSSSSQSSGSSRTRTSRSRSAWSSPPAMQMPEPPGTSARRVESVDELLTARRIQHEAFGGNADEVGFEQAEADFATEGEIGSTFLAFVDGEPVAAGYASYTPLGLLLFGGATLPSARGRGAYRALVAARAREAADRGTPVLVTHAGQMSQADPRAPRLQARVADRSPARRLPRVGRAVAHLSDTPAHVASPPDGNRHVAVHGHRGLDAAAPGARHRAATRTRSPSTAACCATRSPPRVVSRSTRRATHSSSRSPRQPAPSRLRPPPRRRSRRGRSPCGWGSTRARRALRPRATSGSTSTAAPASPPWPTAAR